MFILITRIVTAVINIMPLIRFMALIQCNALDINYASKQRTCTHLYSHLMFETRTNCFTYFRILAVWL